MVHFVTFQIAEFRKSFGTTVNVTFVDIWPKMRSKVLNEVVALRVRFATVLTRILLDSIVSYFMSFQMTACDETHAANFTHKFLLLKERIVNREL